MFERYTERARRCLFFARYEASQLGGRTIDAEHLLLGLVREGKGITSHIFASAQLTLSGVEADVKSGLVRQDKPAPSVDIPFSESSKLALANAAEEADRLLHNYIGTEHLLLGLLRDRESRAGALLTKYGLRLEAVRDEIVRLLNDPEFVPSDAARRNRGSAESASTLTIRISPSASGNASDIHTPGHWRIEGMDLRSMLMVVCGCPASRLELPASIDSTRYDFSMDCPQDVSRDARLRLMLEWMQAYFRMAVTRELRSMDVFVMTAPSGPGPKLAAPEEANVTGSWSVGDGGGFGSIGLGDVPPSPELLRKLTETFRDTREALQGAAPERRREILKNVNQSLRDAVKAHLSVAGGPNMGTTLAEFGYLLEPGLGRPVVDETLLPGRYSIEMPGEPKDSEEFRTRLRDELGLVLVPASRDVTVTVVQAAGVPLRGNNG